MAKENSKKINDVELAVLTNQYYILSEAADIVLRKVELMLNSHHVLLKGNVKYRHKIMMKQVEALKNSSDSFMADYNEAFIDHEERYGDLRQTAGIMAFFSALIADRCGNQETGEAMVKRIENYLKRLPANGFVSADTLRSLKGNHRVY